MRLLSGLVFAFCAAGCSSTLPNVVPDTHKVSGRVLLPSGAPAHGAEIMFVPKLKDGKLSGANGHAVLGKDGAFSLKSMGDKEGIPNGYYAVVLNPNVLPAAEKAEKAFGVANIPKKFWSEDTTDYFVTVDGDKTDLVIQLK